MTTPMDAPNSAENLLSAVYKHLEYDQGALVNAASTPQARDKDTWTDTGDWQQLAAQIGAERIFFVHREPVVVFAKTLDTAPDTLRTLYEHIWCMARPQLLFLATPGELSAFDLTKPPPRPREAIADRDRLLAVARSVAEVQTNLHAYHRERVETGAVFGEERFSNSLNRADRALIRDLKTVRQQLRAVNAAPKAPNVRHLHSLIGRAIFIRYLEDREILRPSYFRKIARKNLRWLYLLSKPPAVPALDPRFEELQFLRVLQDKDFTYAVFDQLACDFDGDTFPIDGEERAVILQTHLNALRGFLTGSTSDQEELFFFAYRFDVIPIELISTIYEEFYNEEVGKSKNRGSHYTPPALVEFVLSQTLTPEILATKPRVLDPACGSGIFLVESFRRIVRHLQSRQIGKRVTRPQLRKVLRDQVAGIDINEEAVRVAAFSLYLAFLHYQEPREINENRRLPRLKWLPEHFPKPVTNSSLYSPHFDILYHGNSFEFMNDNMSPKLLARFGPGTATVVVGNPPWGSPKKDDVDAQQSMSAIRAWCHPAKGRPIGDKEHSQAFVHLTTALLSEGGRAGLLLSSGVLFKQHPNSRAFRQVWLNSVKLEQVVNFAHVRHIFFSGRQRGSQSISPFVSVVFEKSAAPDGNHRFQYWSAKRTAPVENTRSVVLNRGDMHWLSQRDCLEDDKLWKIYWWGGHYDKRLIRSLERFPSLKLLLDLLESASLSAGQGFKRANKGHPASWLTRYPALPSSAFRSYGPLPTEACEPVPPFVERRGVEEVYSGRRLLVARGIRDNGRIISRFATDVFCFRNSIHGIRFYGLDWWQEATITAVFWSSLARYYHFLTSGSWGLWHDELHLNQIQLMPMRFPTDLGLRQRIVKIVEKLRTIDIEFHQLPLAGHAQYCQIPELERDLDDAIFDLFELNAAERDRVHDVCTLEFDFLYENHRSIALAEVDRPVEPSGTLADVESADTGLDVYIRVFLEAWRQELGKEANLFWHVRSPPSRAPLLAVSFSMDHAVRSSQQGGSDSEWRTVLAKLNEFSRFPGNASSVFFDTFFRHVGTRDILFVKRNERRFWTRTAAREDAESTFTYLMNREEFNLGRPS